MKKYRVTGKELENLIDKVAEKLKIEKSMVGYKVVSQEEGKVVVDVWKKDTENNDKREMSVDELLKIDVEESGVFLTVSKVANIDFNTIINFIAEKDIEAPDMEKINEAYEHRGTKFKIAEYYEGLYKESEIDVMISDDKQKAYIFITEPKGMNLPGVEKIISELNSNGVSYGIDENLIIKALQMKRYGEKLHVAEGKMPQKGEDAYVDYKIKSIKRKSILKPTVLENGKVDFKNLDLIENVKAGDLLAEKIAPQKGIDGIDVLGNSIVAKDGKDIFFSGGKNTRIDESGIKIYAEKDGMIKFAEKKINVVNVYETDRVDIHTGNVCFIGGVLVKNDVEPGYNIEAEGNIEVKGNVEKSNLTSTGDILVRGSVFGKETGTLTATNDVIINFAEATIIQAGENVIANEAIMNSKVYAGKKIKVIDRKGFIIGGELKAAEGIEAINIGSHLAIKTDLEVGIDPKVIEEFNKAEAELKEIAAKKDQIEKNILLLQKLKASLRENMPQDKQDLFAKLVSAKFTMEKTKKELEQKVEDFRIKTKDIKNATVDIHGICYPGVKIKIRKGTYFVKEEIQNVRFYYEAGEVKFTALK